MLHLLHIVAHSSYMEIIVYAWFWAEKPALISSQHSSSELFDFWGEKMFGSLRAIYLAAVRLCFFGRWLQTNYSVMLGWLDGVFSHLSYILSLSPTREGLVRLLSANALLNVILSLFHFALQAFLYVLFGREKVSNVAVLTSLMLINWLAWGSLLDAPSARDVVPQQESSRLWGFEGDRGLEFSSSLYWLWLR